MRVLPDEGAGPKVEVSFQASGTALGGHWNNVGTDGSVTRPDGTLFVVALRSLRDAVSDYPPDYGQS